MALAHSEAANPHWTRRPTIGELAARLPGDRGWPVLGNTLKLLRDPAGFGRRMQARHGRVWWNNAFGNPTVVLVGPDANELLLFDRDRLFSSEQGWGPILNLLFPRGLMLMDFEAHRVDRRALSVAFKPEPMRRYAVELGDAMHRAVGDWPERMRFYPAIKQLTLDLAASAFLGIPWGAEADRINRAFVDMVQASVGVVRAPLPFTAMRRGVDGRRFLIDYFTPQIEERRRNLNRQDMFSQFCRATREDGAPLAADEIIDHMNFLLMAAHDTITSSLTSLIWLLGREPEWQERLRDECLSAAPAGEAPGPDSLAAMSMTEMAFKEALRIMPPVPSIPRRALREFSFDGRVIPAGAPVAISPGSVHHDPAIWPDPDRFDPLRFTPEAVRTRHKYAWVPFGGGAHMCLGLHFATMQTRLFIHALLTRRRIVLPEGYAPDWQQWPIPKPRDGLPVELPRL